MRSSCLESETKKDPFSHSHLQPLGGFSFLGARIIDQVIEDLWQKRGLNRAENLTLAGSR